MKAIGRRKFCFRGGDLRLSPDRRGQMIRREFFVKKKPIKEIVRDVKVSRNTVRKVIRSGATAFSYDRRVQPRRKLGAWTAELERMLAANDAGERRERCGGSTRISPTWRRHRRGAARRQGMASVVVGGRSCSVRARPTRSTGARRCHDQGQG